MSDKEIENNASNEEVSETVETPESVDSTPETAETVVEAEEAVALEESVPEAPAETAAVSYTHLTLPTSHCV